MNKREMRRVNPASHLAWLGVLILFLFECAVICGALELKSRTVAKYAPWAFEPFLRLVGEHPDSAPRWVSVEEADDAGESDVTATEFTGLEPAVIPQLMDAGASPMPGDPLPDQVEGEAITLPAAVSTNRPAADEERIAPVG